MANPTQNEMWEEEKEDAILGHLAPDEEPEREEEEEPEDEPEEDFGGGDEE